MNTTEVMMDNQEIARRNDHCRKHGIHWMITRGVQTLPHVVGLLRAVREYNRFDVDNDPHGEHDFGSLEWQGETVFWKIDYYNQSMDGWADPMTDECNRVLTVMLNSEY